MPSTRESARQRPSSLAQPRAELSSPRTLAIAMRRRLSALPDKRRRGRHPRTCSPAAGSPAAKPHASRMHVKQNAQGHAAPCAQALAHAHVEETPHHRAALVDGRAAAPPLGSTCNVEVAPGGGCTSTCPRQVTELCTGWVPLTRGMWRPAPRWRPGSLSPHANVPPLESTAMGPGVPTPSWGRVG